MSGGFCHKISCEVIPDKRPGVYCITNPCGKRYIGSSVDLYTRYFSYNRKNIDELSTQRLLYESFLKHGRGRHTFNVIEYVGDFEDLGYREWYYGTSYDVLGDKGLNSRLPKVKGSSGFMRESMKIRIGISNKNKKDRKPFGHYESKLKSLTVEQVREIKMLLRDSNLTQKQIAEKFSVDRKIISNICIGKFYKTLHTDISLSNYKKKYIKLSKEDELVIISKVRKGVSQKEVAKAFSIDQSWVSRIVNNKKKERYS